MKFRKKIEFVEATQWFKEGDHPAVMGSRPDKLCGCTILFGTASGQPHLHYSTFPLEKPAYIEPGDWIVTESTGKIYSVKPDVFEELFEPAEDSKQAMLTALKGLSAERAFDVIKAFGFSWRVASRQDLSVSDTVYWYELTTDYRDKRINLQLVNDHVTEAYIG
jgi:hypothetical protein